eukprot:jgi/Ulvmu1/6101/UM027_0079.1
MAAAARQKKPFNAQENPGTWLLLYVDDDSINQTVIETMLSSNPAYRVLVSDDKEDVALALDEEPCLPDVVLMDHQLGNCTGEELIVWMREQYSKEMVFVLCTARSRSEAEALAQSAQASGYLCKPYTMKALMAMLSSLGLPN